MRRPLVPELPLLALVQRAPIAPAVQRQLRVERPRELLPPLIPSTQRRSERPILIETTKIVRTPTETPIVVQKTTTLAPTEKAIVASLPAPARPKLTGVAGQPAVLEKALVRAPTRPTRIELPRRVIEPRELLLPPTLPSGTLPMYETGEVEEEPTEPTVPLVDLLAQAPALPDAPDAVFGK